MSGSATIHRMVAAALLADGRVLLARRTAARRWYANRWDLPGGHLEPGESETQALVREIGEELGVMIAEPAGPAAERLFEYSEAGDQIADLSVWVVTGWAGEIRNNSPREHVELRWFSGADLGEVTLAHPEYAELLPRLLAGRP